MSEFFNNYFNVKKMIKSKRDYKYQMSRVSQLPEDYKYVFNKIQEYIWSFTTGSGDDVLEAIYELIDLFCNATLQGKYVLEVTGEDVASFVDDFLKSREIYIENYREKFNSDIVEKLKNDSK